MPIDLGGFTSHFAVLQRLAHVLVARIPMLPHRGAGAFVVLGVALIDLLPVDEMDEAPDVSTR